MSPSWDTCVDWGNDAPASTQAPEVWVNTTKPKMGQELIKERVEKTLEGWPWVGIPSKLMTLGPYIINLYPDDQKDGVINPLLMAPRIERKECLLFDRLFSHRLIFDRVFEYICHSHDSQWKFAATCSEAFNLVRPNIPIPSTHLWDMTNGTFNGCDQSSDAIVKPVLMIAPVRKKGNPIDYTGQVKNLYSMCLSVSNVADNIRNVQFHRVPFLDTNVLYLLIPKMRNLRHLGVYKCELIHFGETLVLLDLIRADRPLEWRHQVNLDFYPNFHRGPFDSDTFYAGPYGVTWDNWNGNSILGIWCMIESILKQAHTQGIDLTTKGTMFRKWLDDGPCWRVEETLKALSNPQYDRTALAALLDCSNRQHHGSVRLFTGHIGNRPEGYKWATEMFRCRTCGAHRMGIFFWYGYIRQARIDGDGQVLKCYGCILDNVLRNERDHYKTVKRSIIRNWLVEHSPNGSYPSEYNRTDLGKALRGFVQKNIAQQASALQARRDGQISRYGYDRETHERQVPYTHKEANTKYGMQLRTPLVWAKNSDPKSKVYENPGDIEWDYAPDAVSGMFCNGRW